MRFVIGEAFPASDPVARFVTVLAMISNDWLRLFELMRGTLETEAGLHLLLFRQQAALHHEAADFIRIARRRFHAEVDVFVRRLAPSARENCERVVGGIDSRSAHYLGAWVEEHRNVTFHYPTLHPEKARAGRERSLRVR